MPASIKSPILYQGLFLIVFALYSVEKRKVHATVVSKDVEASESQGVEVQTRNLDELYRQLKKSSFFETPQDGVKIEKLKTSIKVSFQSDELYRDGEVAVEETWYSELDQMARALFPFLQNRFRVTFIGYASTENDPYQFSSERAEWVYRFYEGKYHFNQGSKGAMAVPKKVFFISGGGSLPNGKRLELEIREID